MQVILSDDLLCCHACCGFSGQISGAVVQQLHRPTKRRRWACSCFCGKNSIKKLVSGI